MIYLKSWSHHFESFTVASMTWWPLWNICVTNDHIYVSLVVCTSQSFPHSWLITGFVTRLTRRVPLVDQELITLPVHLAIVLSVLLRYTDSDYPFGIFKVFFLHTWVLSDKLWTSIISDYMYLYRIDEFSNIKYVLVCLYQ